MFEVPDYVGRLVPEDPRFNALVSPDAKIEVLATGFAWSEGPIWLRDRGFLLFSDIPRNAIMKWSMEDGLSLFIKPSGYTGIAPYGKRAGQQRSDRRQPRPARLLRAWRSARRAARLERRQAHAGRRLRGQAPQQPQRPRLSPLDRRPLLHRSALRAADTAGRRSAQRAAVQRRIQSCRRTANITLLVRDMTRPNGLAFSPDEKTLYVAQSDRAQAIWNALPVKDDGTLGERRLFADVTELAKTLEGSAGRARRSIARGISSRPARAACSSTRRTARGSAASRPGRRPPTARGATMGPRCTSRRTRCCCASRR